jgi:hypothetical protein
MQVVEIPFLSGGPQSIPTGNTNQLSELTQTRNNDPNIANCCSLKTNFSLNVANESVEINLQIQADITPEDSH